STLVGGTPASVMFSFAVLLHYGLSVAVLTQAAAIVVSGLVHRRAWHRTAFNVAHVTLACTAGAVVLGAFGVLPHPADPWVPGGGHDMLAIALAALAYFIVRALLVCGAVALHERRTLPRVLRVSIGHQ